MARVRRVLLALPALALAGAGCAPWEIAEVEEGEWLPGGEATNTLLLGGNAFISPAPNLDDDTEADFFLGNSFFNQAWVEAPASTLTRDGLGPLFNARSCSGCHFRDGRASAPDDPGGEVLGALVRLSVGDLGAPEPTYGGQLQDQALPGVPTEGTLSVSWTEQPGAYADGTPYSLRAPTVTLEALGHGPLDPSAQTSLRVAPHMSGLGLLEGIPEEDLEAWSDPEDRDGDGISGRVARIIDPETGAQVPGRFGWKAEQPWVLTQAAAAFAGDLGVTSRIFATQSCTEAQVACGAAETGGDPELEDHLLDAVGTYSAALAVPIRRDWEDDDVLRGKLLFRDIGCAGCHVPSTVTSGAPLAELDGQSIWPYTDLLLHDMGEGLSDGRSLPHAAPTEWRTPPLWGLGLVPTVNDHDHLLHDGRARGFAEAVLWHGGEALDSRDAFAALDAADRDALVRFLESL